MYARKLTSADALLQETGSLISLPDICLRLRAILDDPDHTRPQILALLRHDPSLTARLLRIVNSSQFGLSTPVRDISHALSILGEHELQNLVMVTSIVQLTQGRDYNAFDVSGFWRASISSAVIAGNLAELVDPSWQEELFIAGLLCNIGQLPLYYRDPELLREVRQQARQSGRGEYLVEQQVLSFDHAAVGASLARRWNFSALLQEAIAGHHADPASLSSLSARLVNLACCLCDTLEADAAAEPPEQLQRRFMDTMGDVAGIQQDSLPLLLERSRQGMEQIHQALYGGGHGA